MEFRWDPDKAQRNLAKHDISFDLAIGVWSDPLLDISFDRVENGEERWRALGRVGCAHAISGRQVPVETAAQLQAWFAPRFGKIAPAADWLGVGRRWLGERLQGFTVRAEERIEVVPEVSLVRALDWMWSVGPFCPYGEREPVRFYPDQPAEVAP